MYFILVFSPACANLALSDDTHALPSTGNAFPSTTALKTSVSVAVTRGPFFMQNPDTSISASPTLITSP